MKSFIINSKRHGLFKILVDDEDFENVMMHKWHIHRGPKDTTWYVHGTPRFNGGYVKLHRFLMSVKDAKIKVDHIDGDGLNNQRSTNLRLASCYQNSANSRVHKDNLTGFKGVSFEKIIGKYWARIMRKGTAYNLGYFNTPEEASKVYEAKAKELSGKFYRKGTASEKEK